MRLFVHIYRLFGRWPFRIALYPVLAWYVLTNGVARRASRDYLQRLHALSNGNTPVPTLRNVLRHFGAFAETMLDKVLTWRGELADAPVQVEGREALLRLRDAGRGGVIVTAHIGNVELCRRIGESRRGLQLNVLVHTRHAERFNRLLKEANPDADVRLIQVTELDMATAVMLAERVAQGEFVVIAADRVPVSRQTEVIETDFLAATARFPAGPYILASVLKCPLLAVIAGRRGDVAHITIRQLAERVTLPRADRHAAIVPLAAAFARLLEAECLAAPLQWFNFYPYWTPSCTSPSANAG
jgi:predicted LPLAT superfamily acyltransferase